VNNNMTDAAKQAQEEAEIKVGQRYTQTVRSSNTVSNVIRLSDCSTQLMYLKIEVQSPTNAGKHVTSNIACARSQRSNDVLH